jgi:succinyl-CoA synthetase alpha subunit
MAILVDKDTKVVVQGITGGAGGNIKCRQNGNTTSDKLAKSTGKSG